MIPMSLVFLASCIPQSVRPAYDFVESKIFLQIKGNPKELVINTLGSSHCKANNPENGCISVAHGQTALITFDLQNSPAWHMTEMKICKGGTKPEFPDEPCSLEKWDRSVFSVSDKTGSPRYSPDKDGIINLTQVSGSLSKFYLLNHNLFEQDYYYMITACKKGQNGADEQCHRTDPPIENKGTNIE
jgi:hypothetical protein